MPQAEEGRPCKPADAADAAKLQALADKVNAAAPAGVKLDSLDADVLAKLAHCASAEINPMAAMFGGYA